MPVKRSRWQGIVRCMIHVVPVAAALLLVCLNMIEFYLGGELPGASGKDLEKLAGLQFAAKLHELVIMASLGTVLFTYICRELTFGNGIPYGALFAGFQITNISFLWSPEFVGTLYHKPKAERRKKWFLITMLVVCTMLGVSVGPSSANLMIPRLDDWPAGGTTFWINATNATLFPSMVDISPSISHCNLVSDDAACPWGGWEVLDRDYNSFWPRLVPDGTMPEETFVSSSLSLRQLTTRHRSTLDENQSVFANGFTMATVASSAVADSITELSRHYLYAAANIKSHEHFKYKKDATFSVSSSQPLTQARCHEAVVDPFDLSQLQLMFPTLSAIRVIGDASINASDEDWAIAFNNDTTLGTIKSLLVSGDSPTLIWIDDPALLYNSSSTLNAVAAFPNTSSGEAAVYSCSMDSRMAQAPTIGTRNRPKVITGAPDGWTSNGTFNASWPRIAVKAEWAAYLNPIIPAEQNATVFSKMTVTAGMWNASLVSKSYNFPFIVESILATMLANGLARISYNSSMIGTLKGGDSGTWWSEMFPAGKSLGWGGNAFAISPEDKQNSIMFTMHATVNGYAYSYRGITQKAAIVVLLLYCVLAVAHVIYSICWGWSTTAWETMPEVAALAMNSQQTDRLYNTGGGIDTRGVYEERVKIRVREDRLEFVFSDTDNGGCSNVNNNQKYS